MMVGSAWVARGLAARPGGENSNSPVFCKQGLSLLSLNPALLAKAGGCGTHRPLTLLCTVLWTVPESHGFKFCPSVPKSR